MRSFLKDETGSVSMVFIIVFSVLVAVAALTVHASQMYVVKVRQQRTSDIALLAAASLPNAIQNGAPSSGAVALARTMADANGFAGAPMDVTVQKDGLGLKVEITKTVPLFFRSIFSTSQPPPVVASVSVGRAGPSFVPCVLSLNTSVTINGSALTGNACGVIAASSLVMPGGQLSASGVAVGVDRAAQARLLAAARAYAPAIDKFVFNYKLDDPVADDGAVAELGKKLNRMAGGWPYERDPPYRVQSYGVPTGTNLVADATVKVAPLRAAIRDLTVAGGKVVFEGSGGPDPSCQRPTTISGVTKLRRGSSLVFESGCYVFGGDIVQDDTAASEFILASPDRDVRIIIMGRITNFLAGNLTFPDAFYSIAGGIQNLGGGTIKFGAGTKVISGDTNNSWSWMYLGAGELVFHDANFFQKTGTIELGGDFYLYNSMLTNGAAGTVRFGEGNSYIYRSTLTNGDDSPGEPLWSVTGNSLFAYQSDFDLVRSSMTELSPKVVELYQSNFNARGKYAWFGSADTAAPGVTTVFLRGGGINHTAGRFAANGVTFAARGSTMDFSGSQLIAIAPTNAKKAGYKNLLMYLQAGSVSMSAPSARNTLSGVIYAPRGRVTVQGGAYEIFQTGGCLSIVGQSVALTQGVSLPASVCSNYIWPRPNKPLELVQ